MKKKTAAIVGLSAVTLGLGAGVNMNFTSEELLHNTEYLEQHSEADYCIHYTEMSELSKADQLRAAIIRLPVAVKALFLLPLWALGAIPVGLVTGLIGSALASTIAGLVLQAAVLIGVFCVVYKLLFPDKKLKELFKKRNLKWLLLGAGGVVAGNWVLMEVWPAWTFLRVVLMLGVGGLVLALLWKRICGKFKAPEPHPVETRLLLEYD